MADAKKPAKRKTTATKPAKPKAAAKPKAEPAPPVYVYRVIPGVNSAACRSMLASLEAKGYAVADDRDDMKKHPRDVVVRIDEAAHAALVEQRRARGREASMYRG